MTRTTSIKYLCYLFESTPRRTYIYISIIHEQIGYIASFIKITLIIRNTISIKQFITGCGYVLKKHIFINRELFYFY